MKTARAFRRVQDFSPIFFGTARLPGRASTIAKPKSEPRPLDPAREHAAFEDLTKDFRIGLAKKHAAKSREAIGRYKKALDAWEPQAIGVMTKSECHIAHDDVGLPRLFLVETGEIVDADGPSAVPGATLDELRGAVTSFKWHEARERGQRDRFDRVRDCGTRTIVPWCRSCSSDGKAIPEPCGVRRVCKRCDTSGALKRRARFGRARGRLMLSAARYGLLRRFRKGGRFSEKMLTVTVPHVARADVDDASDLYKLSTSNLDARVGALFLAWPRFVRKLRRHFQETWQEHGPYAPGASFHRSFEWTPGKDGDGHPHFHVYLWCKWIPRELLREWWAEALRDVGVPVERKSDGASRVVVDLRELKGPGTTHAIRELIKGGMRSALTLSRIEFADVRPSRPHPHSNPGLDAFSYAEGWTLADIETMCTDDVRARLYCALEARRLTQASRGFFVDDEPPACACCGASNFRVRFEPLAPTATASQVAPVERGPP